MEPLGTTASIIAIIQLSSKVFGYITNATGATKERNRLRSELLAFDSFIQELRDQSDGSEEGQAWSEMIKALDGPDGPLGRLKTTLGAMETRLQPKKGVRRAVSALKWPFEEKEVQMIIETIENEKSLLKFALDNEHRKLTQEIQRQSRANGEKLDKLLEVLKLSSKDHKAQLEGLKGGVDRLHIRQDAREADEKCQEILNWLTPLNYAAQQSDSYSRARPGTGQWLLDSDEYQGWLTLSNQTLFCPGIPGAGKTTLTSIIIQNLQERFGSDPTVGIAYVYFNFNRKDDQQLQCLLSGLLKQLAQSQPSLPDILRDLHERHEIRRSRPSLNEISTALKSVANTYFKVYLLIDALDECKTADSCRSKFISEIFALQSETPTNLLATSRFIPEITERFKGCPSKEIRASKEDVDSLKGKRSPKALRNTLKNLAMGSDAYHSAYVETMKRIQGQNEDRRDLAMEVLSWITCAKRPLTTTELQHALAVEIGAPDLDDENITDIADMVSACAGLVTVDNESCIVRLVHYTTQEYFEKTQTQWFPDAQLHIAQVCITYLSFSKFESGFSSSMCAYLERLASNPFYSYSAENWGRHAGAVPASQSVARFLGNPGQVEASYQALFLPDDTMLSDDDLVRMAPKGFTELHLAAYFGLEEIAKVMMTKYDINTEDSHGRTPLSYAAENGQETMVRLLLAEGAKANTEDPSSRTPLGWAARFGHKTVVQMLLATEGINVNAKDLEGDTPLHHAAEDGDETVVGLLLAAKGVDANIENSNGDTPLHIAVTWADEKVVELLLASEKVDANIKNCIGSTPLHIAVSLAYENIVEMLLATGKVDANIKDRNNNTPLHVAVHCAYEKVVELLLATEKVDANIKERNDNTPLHLAVRCAYEKVVKLLLATERVDANVEDWNGNTPLHLAVRCAYEKVVELLLATERVDANIKDRNGNTPLHVAIHSAYEKVVELFLATERVDTNIKDPLWSYPPELCFAIVEPTD
ncbi:hypothetical protein DL767_005285 [Monosporascus sp. MG133]|nr:hypothetical protein DL767_005285 [Monosporascus sp. MG133]